MHYKRRSAALAAACTVLAWAGCREEIRFEPLDAPAVSPGAGVFARAVAVTSPYENESLFGNDLPKAGVLPVHLSIADIDTARMVIHFPDSPEPGGRFEGLVLESGEERLSPLHPIEVAMRIKGKGEDLDYRKIGLGRVMVGTAVAPLGLFYAYEEFRYATEYKPLAERSFFPAPGTGVFEPVVLEPGETVSGFLFFPCDTSLSAARPGDMRLMIRISAYPEDISRFEVSLMPGLNYKGASAASEGGGTEATFVLAADKGREGRLDLFITRICCKENGKPGSGRKEYSGAEPLAELRDRDAELAGGAVSGDLAFCGVNFARTSRLFIGQKRRGGYELAGEARFERNILRIEARDKAALVITVDGDLHFVGGDGSILAGEAETVSGPDDAIVFEDDILVCADDEIVRFELSGYDLHETGRAELAGDHPSFMGVSSGVIALAVRGKRGAGDTLVTVDATSLAEKNRRPAGGRLIQGAAPEGSFLSARSGGVLTVLSPSGACGWRVLKAGWWPLPLKGISSCESGCVLVSEDGRLFALDLEDLKPRAPRGMEDAIPVDVVPRVSAPGALQEGGGQGR